MAKILHINPQKPEPEAVRDAAQALRDGLIIAFPTETVYGIGALRSRPEAVQRLVEIKKQPDDKPLTVHLADLPDAWRLLGRRMPDPAERLAERYWPGPLTLVVPGDQPGEEEAGEMIGLRVVGDPVSQAIIRAAGGPLMATSANIHGQPPAVSGAEVRLKLADHVDLIIDAGPAQLQEASTVVAVSPQAFKVLRAGVITESNIERTATERVCFVCTGNICRSPMAAALMLKLIDESADQWLSSPWQPAVQVSSAGVRAIIGEPMTREANRALIDFDAESYGEGMRGRMLTPDLLDRCDRVLVATREHIRQVAALGPQYADKVELLDPDGKDVADPYGETLTFYRRTATRIHDLLKKRFFALPSPGQ